MKLPDKYIFGLTETEYRPCLISFYRGRGMQIEERKKALFHKWTHEAEIYAPAVSRGGHQGGNVSTTLGIVEFEDGTVATVRPDRIQFLDTHGFMDQICYGEEEPER